MSEAPLPESIGRYRPIARLGAGAMGVVYKAHDPAIDRIVAIKLVPTAQLDPESRGEYLDRFRQEVQAAARCAHPSIVAVHDFAEQDGAPYIVMEFIEGQTLQEILRAPTLRARLDHDRVMQDVLAGLGYAHARGVIHRDIKPANIMVTPSGEAKIADFGIARLSDSGLTHAGQLLGTPRYMAPEQVIGTNIDHRADLFAAGAVLYEILIGRPPFLGRNLSETVLRLTNSEPASMDALEAADATRYAPVLSRALAKRPDLRFQTAEEFAAALRAVAGMPADPAATVVLRREPSLAPAPMPSLPRWDPLILQQVETSLARHIGPMARVLVSQATRQASNLEELYGVLVRSLPDEKDRRAFLRSVPGGRVEPSLGATSASSLGLGSYPRSGFPPEALEAAQATLAKFMGPIARVLVRKAAAEAISGEDFCEKLCAALSKPEEVTALRRRLKQEVEPKLR